MKIMAITCVKNEGPFLLEWIAFNRVIGVNDFLFFSNDCTDGTDHLLDKLVEHEIVRHVPNPAQGRNYQMEALKYAKRRSYVKDADWVWIADVDEFLNIHVGDHTIPALIKACKNPQAISITFQFMANDGIETFEDKPVISQFVRSHNPDIWCGDTAIEVKTLVRKDFPTDYFGAHRPFHNIDMPRKEQPSWTDANGRNINGSFRRRSGKRRIRAFPSDGARKFATLNHYALRSLDSYLVKNDRGDVNREFREFDDTYWRERNDSIYFDDSILRYIPALKREMDVLKSLPGIRDLHDEAVAQHRKKRDELLNQEHYQAMRDSLLKALPFSPDEEELMKQIGLL